MRFPHSAPLLALSALCVSLIASAPPAGAQQTPAKLDPLLRRLVDPAVTQAVEAAPQLEEMGRVAGFPAAQLLDFTRPRPGAGTFVTVFVSLTDRAPEVIEAAGGIVGARMGSLFTARVPIAALTGLAADPRVRYVRASVRVELENDLAMADIRADLVRTRSGTEFTGATGRGVILGFVDSGIDFAHGDFRNPDGSTRILYIWDQTASGAPPGNVGGQVFSSGNECDAAEINAGTCSQRDNEGHGSHVAGIAAGDGSATGGGQPAFQYAGVAPHADVVMVKTTLTIAAIIEGIQYIFKRAEELGRPAVVNLSVGLQFSSHDGTDPWEQALDSLSGPGRIITVSAGNEGSNQNSIASQPPLNYIHATRSVTSGDTAQITLTVPSYSPNPNDFDFAVFTMWYDGRDTITVTVTRPNGTSFSRRTGQPDALSDNAQGAIYLDNASQGAAAQNGDHELYAEIIDNIASQPPAAGTWRFTVRLDHRGGNGRFDVWMWATNLASSTEIARFTGGGDNAYSVSAPGNAARAIAVGAHATRTSWTAQGGAFIYDPRPQVGDLAPFSSSGPTRPLRDGPSRQKPDFTAPGMGIFSVRSANAGFPSSIIALDGVHVVLAGTSMSAPMVAGAVALLLERNPSLTPELVQTILQTSARQDGFTTRSFAGFGGGAPNPSWGYGKLDVEQALALVPTQLTVSPGPATGTMGGAFVLPRADVPSVQMRVIGSSTDDIRVTGLRLRSDGSGNDATGVAEVRLYADADSNGTVDPTDPLLGSAPVSSDDGEADLAGLDLVIPAGGLAYLLAAYSLNGTPAHGDTFRVSLETPANVTAERAADMTPVTFTGSEVAGDVVQAQAIGTLTVAAAEAPSLIVAPGQTNAVLFRVVAQMDSTESFDLRRLVATLGGTADPATTVHNVRLWQDQNRNGVRDQGDSPGPTLATDITGPTIAVDLADVGFVGTFDDRHWLVLADVRNAAVPGASISFTLDSLVGLGTVTDSAVAVIGLPIAGPALDVVRTTVTATGTAVDSATVFRNATALPLARVRFETLGERVIVDSLVFRMSGTLAPQGLANLYLFADLDSNGVAQPGEPVFRSGLAINAGGEVFVVPEIAARLESGSVWWVLAGDGADNATWGQTFQVRLDSMDFYARGEASGESPLKEGAAAVTGRFHTIGGRAALTVVAGPNPPPGPVVIGPNAALQWSVAATTLEGASIDSVFVEITGVAPTVVDRLELYVDSAGAGAVPSHPPVVAIDDPFTGGDAVRLGGFSVPLDAGGSLVLLFATRVTDRLRQGDSLAVAVSGIAGTGQLSGQPALVSFVAPSSSALARATLLEPGETFLVSENPVRSGRVIFSYGQTPRAVSLYTFAGLRVRHFTDLPADRFEWDVRAEAPGLPNGMYVLVVDTGEAMLRSRLMILSPGR